MAKVARLTARSPSVTVLSIDPGFAELGYAVVRHERGIDHVLDIGVIWTKTGNKRLLKSEDAQRRLRYTSERLWALADKYEIDAIAFESISMPQVTSKQNAVKIGFAYALIAMLAAILDIAMVMRTPQAVKMAVCGTKSASKGAVEKAVRVLFGGHPAVLKFINQTARGRQNHGFDALAAYVAAGDSDVMKALKRSA